MYSGLGDCRLSYISSQALSGFPCSAVLGVLQVKAVAVTLAGRRKSHLAIGGRSGDECGQASGHGNARKAFDFVTRVTDGGDGLIQKT